MLVTILFIVKIRCMCGPYWPSSSARALECGFHKVMLRRSRCSSIRGQLVSCSGVCYCCVYLLQELRSAWSGLDSATGRYNIILPFVSLVAVNCNLK
jgi:hypothetical protein